MPPGRDLPQARPGGAALRFGCRSANPAAGGSAAWQPVAVRVARLLVPFAVSVLLAGGLTGSASAAGTPPDDAAPVVASLAFSPATIHAGTGVGSAKVVAHVVDGGSGLAYLSVYVVRDRTDGAGARFDVDRFTMTSGTWLDGVHEGQLIVGHNTAGGRFAVHVVTVDRAGNRLDRIMPDPVEIGADHGDDEAPLASDVNAGPPVIAAGATVTVNAHITEPGESVLIEATASAVWTSGGNSATYAVPLAPTSQNTEDGGYRAVLTVPQWAPNGAYELRVRTVDGGGNAREQSFGNRFTVRDGRDQTEFADLMGVDIPSTVEVSTTGGVAQVAMMAGSLAGVREFLAWVEHTNADGSVARYDAAFAAAGPAHHVARIAIPAAAPRGVYWLSMRFTDNAGIVTQFRRGSQVSVVSAPDVTAPVLHLPGDLTVDAAGRAGTRIDFTATAVGPVTCAPASGSVFPLGTSTVTCRADGTTGTFQVTVADRTPPVLSLPADVTVDAGRPSGAHVRFTATAGDAVDGPVPVTCAPAARTRFPPGATTVACQATDRAGNRATGTFTVSVADDGTQLRSLRAYVVSLRGPGRPLLRQVDAVLAATAYGRWQRAVQLLDALILRTRLSPLTDARQRHIVAAAARIRDYHRHP